jgi:hypothetical protein
MILPQLSVLSSLFPNLLPGMFHQRTSDSVHNSPGSTQAPLHRLSRQAKNQAFSIQLAGPFFSRSSTQPESDSPPPADAPLSPSATSTDKPITNRSQRWKISPHLLITLGLLVVALLPRLYLALKLDLVTDEVVYIQGGKVYLPLLAHFDITAHGWTYNYEHPPLVKILIGIFLWGNDLLGHPFSELLVGRLPSVLMGTALVLAVYLLGRGPCGRVVALAAALSLALSPWLSYFSALAYLDMTMTAFITIAYLLAWHATRRPWLYLLLAILVGCGAASKYTAVLITPALLLYTAYYFFVLRPRLPAEQRPSIPWLWWLAAIVVAPLAFLIADPAIWRSPITLLQHSFTFEWDHSINGHLTFLAGRYDTHVPRWAIVYIVGAKISAFVTIPAALFALYALFQLARFHLRGSGIQAQEANGMAFVVIWLLTTLGMFSLLNIVVGTHYHLPLAAPVALAGAGGLATILRYRRGALFKPATDGEPPALPLARPTATLRPRAALLCTILLLAMTGSHLLGLFTVPAAEGYTSELFPGEDSALQVAYPAYHEALQWLSEHDSAHARVGLAAVRGTLNIGNLNSTWYAYNVGFASQFQMTEVGIDTTQKTEPDLQGYDYVIWPMHLIQRGYPLPSGWSQHIIYTVSGGKTTYCYIMARPTASLAGWAG